MAASCPIRRALISVYDKTGIVEFARALHDEFGVEIISTGGTARALTEAGIPVTLVETVTGFPEMLEGRVKTLHPKIHAAILADRDNPEHMRQLGEAGIEPIDMVVVNLYPFEKTVADPNCTFEQAIEMIDIGGPCLLRAAAKNHRHVIICTKSVDCEIALGRLRKPTEWGIEDLRTSGAFAAFDLTARYDAAVSAWLSAATSSDGLPLVRYLQFWNWGKLRYGENPHQSAELLDAPSRGLSLMAAETDDTEQANLSFNNYVDASAALKLCAELTRALGGASASGSSKLRFERDNEAEVAEERSKRSFELPGSPALGAIGDSPVSPIRDEHRSRRNLPHWQIPGATYWITFRSRVGILTDEERDLTMSALRFWDRKRLDLHAAVVMPDHVHALFTPRARVDRPGAFENLSALLKSIKGFSGREISQRRCDSGEGWVHESYDRWIRNEADFAEKWNYLADNVVKEGLAPTPGEYRWWYAVDYFGRGIGRPVSPETPLPPVLGGTLAESAGDSTAGTEGGAASSCKAELCTPRHRGGSTRICVFIKHTNACGVGTAHAADDSSQGTVAARVEAYRRAYLGDPNAAMGGILAVNFPVDAEFAATVMEAYARFGKPLRNAGPAGPAHPNPPGAFFIEVWIAPRFTDDAVAVIRGTYDPDQASPDEAVGETILDSPPPKKDWGKRVRLLAVGDMAAEPDAGEMDLRKIAGGVLMQTPDLPGLNEDQWKVVTKRAPDEREMSDLRLAWLVCKHTKSNAITLCRDGMLIGNGAGQMSRVMSCRIATWLARENGHMGGNREQGTGNGEEGTGNGNRRSDEQGHSPVAASDAFFPFRDGVDVLIEAGVSAIIQPGGSKRDAEVIAACDERDVAMIFTGTRHFRH